MAGKVFFSVTMSLDGFIAPESVPVGDFFAPDKRTTRTFSAGWRSGRSYSSGCSRCGSSGRI
jgi:hypothetical protein